LVLGAQPAVVGQQRLVALAQRPLAGALGVREPRPVGRRTPVAQLLDAGAQLGLGVEPLP